MKNNSIHRVVLVGYGSIGKRHYQNLQTQFPGVLIAIVSGHLKTPPNDETILIKSIDSAVQWQPDFALLASPANRHTEQALPFLKNGIPVLVEKPLDVNLETARKLSPYASSPGILLGYCLRFHPVFTAVSGTISSGQLGDISSVHVQCKSYLPEWRKDTDYRKSVSASSDRGGGVLLEVSHEIDYVCALFGRPQSVACQEIGERSLGLDVEENVLIRLKYENFEATLELSFASKDTLRDFRIQGRDGKVHGDFVAGTVTTYAEDDVGVCQTFSSPPNEMYLRELMAMADTVAGKPPAIGFPDGLLVLEVIEACRRSMDNNSEVSSL